MIPNSPRGGSMSIDISAVKTIGSGILRPEGVMVELKVFLEDPQSRVLKRPSNICFGWEERRTAFIGSLDGSTIPYFEVPYPGMKLIHQQ
jgi:hypothetical protein